MRRNGAALPWLTCMKPPARPRATWSAAATAIQFANASDQRVHAVLLVGRALAQAGVPGLDIRHLGTLDRQVEPAEGLCADRDVADGQLIAGDEFAPRQHL